ncbi:MAG: adenylate/guanylate cyclase [Bacteroidetes bacterium]|nr:adenylate/guanylate cyclase [Bacteroidota bacterium]
MNSSFKRSFVILAFLIPLFCLGQTKEEQLKKIKNDLKQQQEEIKYLQEQHAEGNMKQIDDLNKQKRQKEAELAKTLQEANQSKEQAKKSEELAKKSEEQAKKSAEELVKKSQEAAQSQQELAQSQADMQKTTEQLLHQEDSIKLLKQEQSLKDLELNNQKLKNEQQAQASQMVLVVLAMVSLILIGVGLLYFTNRRQNKILAVKNKLIEEEKKKSEELLLNILPKDVVEELKSQGKTTAKSYSLATVLFADIKDFTAICETLSPEDLVSSLDAYFETFDQIIGDSKVEKVKTIGDAYVCVGGVPIANKTNPEEVVLLGLQFQKAVLRLKEEREKAGKPCFEVRIGIHTGPVVAGVVGSRKFAYDIWGDTVNVAARLQQHGEAYQVNISRDTYDIIKDRFSCTHRGKLDVKGKGDIDMYFVDKQL